ncbi:MAG: hypothetical protein V5A43_01640 [Haloarculaceae archaeon]
MLLLIAVSSGPYTGAMSRLPIICVTGYWSGLHGWAAILDANPSLLFGTFVPASLLSGVGYYAAKSNPRAPKAGYLRGAWIAGGYAPLVILSYGWVVLRVSGFVGGIGVTAGRIGDPLSPLVPILVTGRVFPALFGDVGGHIAEWRLGE